MNDDRKHNVLVAAGLFWAVGCVIWFVVSLIGSSAGERATALATVIGGSFALGAALAAWKSIQAQIAAQGASTQNQIDAQKDTAQAHIKAQQVQEETRTREERVIVEKSLTAELLVISTAIVQATSDWNERAHRNPHEVPRVLPKLIRPRIYDSVLTRIGVVSEGWAVAALITFYANLHELNEIADESAAARHTIGLTSEAIARRFQMMAANLAEALDGLNNGRKFNATIASGTKLIAPDGTIIENADSQQSLLLALGCKST